MRSRRQARSLFGVSGDIELYDIPPAFQNRLLKWLGKHREALTVRAQGDKFLVTPRDPRAGSSESKNLEHALNHAMRSSAEARHVSKAFQRRIRRWLEENNGEIVLEGNASVDGEPAFSLTLSVPGATVHAIDEDVEVALVFAEEALAAQSMGVAPYSDAEVETVAARTRRMPDSEAGAMTIPARTRVIDDEAVETIPAATIFEEGRTLPEAGLTENARWTRAYVNSLPDSAFLYVEPGGRRDRVGRSHPLSLRHLPYRSRTGKIDEAHLRAALSRSHQERTDLPEHVKAETYRHAQEIYGREFGYAANTPPPRRPARGSMRGRELPTTRQLVEREEARERREERPFDPEARYERHTRSHHFAVNHARARYAGKDFIREVMLGDTGYVLVVWDSHQVSRRGEPVLGYAFYEPGVDEPLFEGEDFGASPMHAIDSDETLRALISFLTLRPGDTDREYFADYSERQLDWARSEAEALSMFAMRAEELGGEAEPLVDVA